MAAQLEEYEADSEDYAESDTVTNAQAASGLSPKLERRRRIEELLEAKRLREELDF